jgi:hypothetical protein
MTAYTEYSTATMRILAARQELGTHDSHLTESHGTVWATDVLTNWEN